MTETPEEPAQDRGGFDVDDWDRLAPFAGRVATLEDVQDRRAIFALGETENPRRLDMALPQPVIWWSEDGALAAVAVQAEAHDTDEGETMEVLGLVLADGEGVVALLEDVDLVDAGDPTWRQLTAEAIGDPED